MKSIARLAWFDLRRATSNVMAIIVLFGLVVIPSLFTWFNVIASWDPFSNTKNLTVAVASTDDGYESDLIPIRINVGEQVLSALRANDQLDWVITSKEDAIDGTESGEYYAAIVLPPSFSKDMLTFYSDGSEPTQIAYYTNEKKNALAPKITGQGADGVSAQITEVFTKTLGDIALSLIDSISEYVTSPDTQAVLTRLEARVSGIADGLRAGADTADMFTSLVDSTIPLVDSASSLVTSSGAAFGDASHAVGSGVEAVGSLGDTLQSASRSLASALKTTVDGYDAVGKSVDDLFATGGQLADDQADVLDSLADRVQQQVDRYTAVRDTLVTDVRPLLPAAGQDALDVVIDRINEAIERQQAVHDRIAQAADDLRSGAASAETTHDEILATIDEAKKAVTDAQESYTATLKPELDELARSLDDIRVDISGLRSDLAGAAARLSADGSGIRDVLTQARTATSTIATTLTEDAGKFDDLEKALATAADTGDLTELTAIIGSDPSALAASLAEPVRVDRVAVFPVASFGAAMTPLYLTLALWVGALLMTVALRVDVRDDALPGDTPMSPTQKYLGRYALFGILGLAQSTLVAGGLILFVQIEPAHPLLLMVAAWVSSIVFTTICYTLVVALGNAGKAVSVLLLVIQISSSGGAYPLQLLPQWFQNISPYLPATHSVAAMRSAIAGEYGGDFWISIGWLALFLVPALLLGLVIRRPFMRLIHGLTEAIESTKLM